MQSIALLCLPARTLNCTIAGQQRHKACAPRSGKPDLTSPARCISATTGLRTVASLSCIQRAQLMLVPTLAGTMEFGIQTYATIASLEVALYATNLICDPERDTEHCGLSAMTLVLSASGHVSQAICGKHVTSRPMATEVSLGSRWIGRRWNPICALRQSFTMTQIPVFSALGMLVSRALMRMWHEASTTRQATWAGSAFSAWMFCGIGILDQCSFDSKACVKDLRYTSDHRSVPCSRAPSRQSLVELEVSSTQTRFPVCKRGHAGRKSDWRSTETKLRCLIPLPLPLQNSSFVFGLGERA